jgi:hypothetical protein
VLTWLGFGMVVTFMTLIMTKRLSPLVALISIPVLFALLGGFGGAQLGEMMLAGLRTLAPTGVMLMFAILYFGLMIDVGLFDPLIAAILRVVGNDPLKVVVGTALLATLVSLDGDGSTTYMITVACDVAALSSAASGSAESHLRHHSGERHAEPYALGRSARARCQRAARGSCRCVPADAARDGDWHSGRTWSRVVARSARKAATRSFCR